LELEMPGPALPAETAGAAEDRVLATATSASPDQGDHAMRAKASPAGEEGRNVTSGQASSDGQEDSSVMVFHIMTRETAACLQVSDVEFATMAEQCDRLSENIKLCSGLSERVIEVTKSEAVHALDIQSRAKDGHKLHAGGRLLARRGPKNIADDDSAQKQRRRDGVARVYPPLGGSDQPDLPYDKPDLEIKGARALHGANATLIVGLRSEYHCDTRIRAGESGALGQIGGHVVYVLRGPGCELHIHRLAGDLHLFSRSIAVGAFKLYMGSDGFLAIKLLDDKGTTEHGAVAVGPPRMELLARHELPARPCTLQVHAAHTSLCTTRATP
jgi:hypothetical protein